MNEELRHWEDWAREDGDEWVILDPDGFRHGRPQIVTREGYEHGKSLCTLVHRSIVGQWVKVPER